MAKEAKTGKTEKDIAAYEKQRAGRFVLVLIGLVTAVNLVMQLCGWGLVFPCSVWTTRFLVGLENLTRVVSIGVTVAVVLILFLFQTAAGNRQFANMRVFRVTLIFYILDSLFYFAMNASEMTASSGRIAFIIELAFRLYCLYAMFEADKVHSNPARYDKPTEKELENARKKKVQEQRAEIEEEDDEGIQW